MADLEKRLTRLLKKLAKKASSDLPRNFVSLFFNQFKVGHLPFEEAVWLSKNFSFFSFENNICQLICKNSEQVTHRLAMVSYLYKQFGKVKAWRDECLSLVPFDDFGRTCVLGSLERAMFRVWGLNTFAVHLNVFTPSDDLWLGVRSRNKAIGPGLLDNCAAGMVTQESTFKVAMDREALEEAGILPGQFNYRFVEKHLINRPVDEGWMRENTIIFSTDVSRDFHPINQDGEVQEFRLVTLSQAINLIEENQFTFESSLSTLIGIAEKLKLPTNIESYLEINS